MRSRRRVPALLLGALLSACTPLSPGAGDAPAAGTPRTVVFLAAGAEVSLEGEPRAAWRWLSAHPDVDARFLQLADLAVETLPAGAVLWFHHGRRAELPSSALRQEAIDVVRRHVEAGGGLLLSLFAATWTVPLGIETRPPNLVARLPGTDFVRWTEDDDRVLAGFESFRGHPVLRRFWGGTYTATPTAGRTYAVARYEGDVWPERGAVVAVGKRYIGIDTERRILVEYPPTAARAGRVVTVGEALWFDDRGNRNRTQLELLTEDLFAYLDGDLPPAPPGASIPSTGAGTVPIELTADSPPTPDPPMPLAAAEPAAAAASPIDLPSPLAATTHWTPRTRRVLAFSPAGEASPNPSTDASVMEAVTASRSGLALEATADPAVPFDLYGPRTLMVGDQSGAIRDLWAYPYRVLRDLRFGVSLAEDDILWLDDADATRTFVSRPEGDTLRVVRNDGVAISLHLAVMRESGGLVALLQVTAPGPVTVLAEWQADHGVMWPREHEYLGDLRVGWHETAHAAVWGDPAGDLVAVAGFGRLPVAHGEGRGLAEPAGDDSAAGGTATGGGNESAETAASEPIEEDGDPEPVEESTEDPDEMSNSVVSLVVPLDPATDAALPFVLTTGTDGLQAVLDRYTATLEDPAAVWTGNANHWRQFLGDTLDIATPDPTFDEAFRWAKVGLEAFRVTTPGLGTGLVAGYAASKDPEIDTWHAENDFLRRPGYGWYFGRDTAWTTFAADAYGGTDLTSESLRLLARYQDVDGKIIHEMSPAGALHYDAADSTPLFLLAVEHHVRATGDRELLRTLWPSVRRAMAYLEGTDTDGDGLIENTGVGHGWIEGGRFYGAHTTLYLANVWAATLAAVERMAGWMADQELADSVAGRSEAVTATIESEFWDAERRMYHHGKKADGTFMPIRTILPAVGMVLGVLDEARVRPLLDMFAGAEVSTDWGARMAERSNPDYDPEGYHDGSVWPLYSGWTSLAAYRYHRPQAAFAQLYGNLRLYRFGSLGYLPEVLHGERYEAIGVTQHQAWSQAMAVLPAVEGMLGIRADALAGTLRIHPHLPGGWNRVVAQRVRVGPSSLKVTVAREDESTRFEIERLAGNEPVQLELSLPFPRAVLVNLDRDATRGVAFLGSETIIDHPNEKEAVVTVSPTDTTAIVVFRHSPYPQVTPLVSTPEPGAGSRGLRIVETEFRGGQLHLRVEGRPGERYRIGIATPWRIESVTGVPTSSVPLAGPGRAAIEIMLPGEATSYQRAELRIDFRR